MNRLVLAAAAFSLMATGAAAQELLADANKDGKITVRVTVPAAPATTAATTTP